ncbi:non-ribosomal peptide synthetase [Corynebacterium sp. HMSC11E11]|uniref:non-ribosomal peptide synthetase n=1 Tax=Corynebacterium sp. HMSC11E11 TaxID=1581089 RepID=UPI0008A612CE|nr:non-ribosomal peptide synthetase [Corynebacterium sp. HMSC11E11]OFU55021.1 hypothetical protein HMPREF3121_06700 [Corynebacterium sp. HMSC11E11]
MRDLEEVRRLMARHRGESGTVADRPARSLPDRAPASAAQKSVWLASALDPDDVSYNLCLKFTFEGRIDAEALAGAFGDLVDRHEVLRTTYHADDEGALQQRIHADLEPEITRHAMPPGDAGDAAVDALAAEQVRRPFDLAAQSPLRLAICERGPGRVDAVMVIQHIAWDGMTMPVLARDVARAYRLRTGRPTEGDGSVPPLAVQVADFAEWEATHPDASGEDHWRSVFPDGVPQMRPMLGGAADAPPNAGGRVDAVLPDDAARALTAIAEESSVTPFAVFLAAHHLVLRAVTGARDTVTGTTVANREAVGADELIGNFSNQVPIRISDGGAETFGDLVLRAARSITGAMSAKSIPFDRIAAIAGVDRAAGETLFPVLVLFLHEGIAGPRLPGAETSWELVHADAALHAVATEAFMHPGRVEVQMTHRLDSVSAEGARALQRALAAVLSNAGADVPTEELAQVARAEIESAAAPASAMGRGRRVPVEPGDVDAMIRAASAASPDAVAVVAEDRTLTYAEFDARVSALAARLAEAGARAGEIVAVVAERGSWLPCAITAVIRTGAAVVPVDPRYPAERIRMMLDDAAPAAIVRAGDVPLPDTAAAIIDVERIDEEGPEAGTPEFVPARPIRGDDPVYLIYTSGTTGRPKGVVNHHRGVASHLQWMARTFGDGPIRMLHKAPISFDVGMGEVLLALTSGGTAVIPPADWWAGDAEGLASMIEEHRVTVLSLVPGLLRELLAAGAAGRLRTLRHLLLGGEAVPTDLARRARAEIGCRVHGLYGPSETAMDVAWVEYGDDFPEDGFLLGAAEDNNDLHVLDENLRELPVGEAGELCIGGVQVGHGYHGAPDATADAFVDDPFEPGGTLYRTGDVAKWGADGMLRFLGRIGDQVKIRGNRVELLDIDAALCRVHGVAAGACRLFGVTGAPARLVGYVVAADGGKPDERAILAELDRALPAYMVPRTIVAVDSLPTTATGKLDRAALPEPPGAHAAGGDADEPRGAAELAVADAFARAIGKDVRPTAQSGLIELGGDSITAIRAISLLRRSGWEAEVRDILGGGTVRTVAAAARPVSATDPADGADGGGFAAPAPVHPLAAALLESAPGGGGLCQARLLTAPADFGAERLSEVLERLAGLHPILSRAVAGDGGWPMFAEPPAGAEPFTMAEAEAEVAAADGAGELIGELASRLDPARGTMLAGAVAELPAGRRIVLVAHHLVVDAVSWETLIDDFRDLRGVAKHTAAARRPEAAVADHARRLRAATLSGELDEDLAAWEKIAADASGTLAIDPARDTEATVDIAEITMPEASSAALAAGVERAFGCRGQDLLIAGLAMALRRLGLDADGTVGMTLESHGRDATGSVPPVPPDAVGWFTAAYPVAVEVGDGLDPVAAVHAVRRARRRLPDDVHVHGCAMWVGGRPAPRPIACLNHLGTVASDAREGDFAPAPEAPALIGAADASAPLPNVIDVTSHVGADGLLAATIRVAAEVPGAPGAADVGRELGAALADIAAAAATGDARRAPADFTAPGITDADVRAWGGEIEDVLPLTPMQEGLMLSSLTSGDPAGYAVQTPLRVRGRVDAAALGRAVGAVLRRFPNLRIQPAATVDGTPVGVVRPCGAFGCRVRDANRAPDLIAADAAEGFDFAAAPLLRITVAHPGDGADGETLVLISAHHILTDGWTGQLLPLAIFAEYAREIGADPGVGRIGDPGAFPALLEAIAEDGPEARRAWEARLRGVVPALVGPEATPTRAGQSSRMSSVGQDVVDRLHAVTRRLGVTPAVAYQAAWARTLGIVLGRDDVVFGEVVSGRDPSIAGVAEGIGCFANLVAVPASVDPSGTWAGALAQMRDERLPLLGHDHFPMTRALSVTGARRLFDTMFVHQSYPPHQDRLASILESCGLGHVGTDPGGTTDNAALLMVFPGDSVIGGAGTRFLFTFAAGVIDDAAAEVIEKLFLGCVRAIADAPDAAIADGPVPDEFDAMALGGILR